MYREAVNITKPLAIVGHPNGTWIRGSDVWASWIQVIVNGATLWQSSATVPAFASITDSYCSGGSGAACGWREQVFYDGRALTQVAINTTPHAGQFSLSSTRNVLLADLPSGHVVEVSVRERAITISADSVLIRGMLIKHAASNTYDYLIFLCVFLLNILMPL